METGEVAADQPGVSTLISLILSTLNTSERYPRRSLTRISRRWFGPPLLLAIFLAVIAKLVNVADAMAIDFAFGPMLPLTTWLNSHLGIDTASCLLAGAFGAVLILLVYMTGAPGWIKNRMLNAFITNAPPHGAPRTSRHAGRSRRRSRPPGIPTADSELAVATGIGDIDATCGWHNLRCDNSDPQSGEYLPNPFGS